MRSLFTYFRFEVFAPARSAPPAIRGALGAVMLATASGCVVGDFDAEDRRCPCVEGFVCDEIADRCVRPISTPDAGFSADDAGFPSDSGVTNVADAGFDTTCSSNQDTPVFCDGFELPELSGWTGVMLNTGTRGMPSTVERQSDRVYRGTGALRARLGEGSLQAAVFADVFTSTTPPELWTRGYFYMPTGLSNETEYIGVSDSIYRESIVASIDEFEADIHSHNLGGERGFFETFDSIFPKDEWVCVELFVRSAEDGIVEIYWNGNLQYAYETDPRFTNLLTRINVGFVDWRSGNRNVAREVYVDEVVVDTQRAPCD